MQMPVRPDRQLPGAQTALSLAEALLEAKHEHGYILPASERSALHGVITVAARIAKQELAGRYAPAPFHERLDAIREKLNQDAVQAGAAVCIASNGAEGITEGEIYPLLPYAAAQRLGLLRLVDDYGKPALHPAEMFNIVPSTGAMR